MARASVETEIHKAIATLTSAEARAARALLADYPTLGLAPVAEFASAAGASAATVLRFVAQLGYPSYPSFQRRLREELSNRIKTPLDKTPPNQRARPDQFLMRFADAVTHNLKETARRIPEAEFEAICARLANPKHECHIAGGRFTDSIAAYMVAHLRIVRSGVRKLEERAVSRADQLLDVGARHTLLVFDIRRYDKDLLALAKAAKARRAQVILVTDTWISPVSRYARHVLPCAIDVGRTWDSSTALFGVAEAIIARVTERNWSKARSRVQENESFEG